jgi:hypothetical protein
MSGSVLMRIKKSQQIAVNQAMLYGVRDELKHEVTSVLLETRSLNHRMDAFESRMDSFEKRMDAFDSKLDALENRMDAKFERVLSELQRLGVLIEEQNNRNRYVLDGYVLLNEKLDRQQKEIDEIKTFLFPEKGS